MVRRLPRVQPMEGRNEVRRAGRGKVNTTGKFAVVAVLDMNRETRLELGDARNRPVIQELAFRSRKLGDWQLIIIADNKALARVIQGKTAGGARVEGVEEVLKTRCLVDGLAEGVRGLQLKTIRKALLKVRLERVVGGVGNRVLGENVGEDWDLIRRAANATKLTGR